LTVLSLNVALGVLNSTAPSKMSDWPGWAYPKLCMAESDITAVPPRTTGFLRAIFVWIYPLVPSGTVSLLDKTIAPPNLAAIGAPVNESIRLVSFPFAKNMLPPIIRFSNFFSTSVFVSKRSYPPSLAAFGSVSFTESDTTAVPPMT